MNTDEKIVTSNSLQVILEIQKDYIDNESSNLLESINKKCNVEVCDNQYEFDQILTKDNNTIYLIKGDQDVWAAKDYVDELWDLVAELRNRLNNIEGISLDDTMSEEPGI